MKDIVILTALVMAMLSGEYSILFQVQFQVRPQYYYQFIILLTFEIFSLRHRFQFLP